MSVLRWNFDYAGQWSADSQVDGEGMYQWRIGVCDDGTFDVSESDVRLTKRRDTFDTLKMAKAWCEREDSRLNMEQQYQKAAK